MHPIRFCIICGEKHYGLGFCLKHYKQTPEFKKRKKDNDKKYQAQPIVKERLKKYLKEYLKKYYAKIEVQEHRKIKWQEYYANPENKKRIKNYFSKPEIRKKIMQIQTKKYTSNFGFKLRLSLSNSFRRSLNTKKELKKSNWEKELGYTRQQLKEHLEKQFTKKMTWENHGFYWEIDHIIPISWFPTKESLVKKGWALNNLQPLPKKQNNEKRNLFVQKTKDLAECNPIIQLPNTSNRTEQE